MGEERRKAPAFAAKGSAPAGWPLLACKMQALPECADQNLVSGLFTDLLFVGGALQPCNGKQHGADDGQPQQRRWSVGEIGHQNGRASAKGSDQIHDQNRAALAQS